METLVKNKKNLQPEKAPKTGKIWVFAAIFIVLLAASVHFFGNFSENLNPLGGADKNLQKSRFEALQHKILAKESLSEQEKAEFCQLLFQIKGFTFENCAEKTDADLYFLLTYRAKVGTSSHKDYRKTFFEQNPTLKGKVFVHHAVEQAAARRTFLFTESELHSLENLRGIPLDLNVNLHLRAIRIAWDLFYRNNPTASRNEILDFASYLDLKYGHQFLPPIKNEN